MEEVHFIQRADGKNGMVVKMRVIGDMKGYLYQKIKVSDFSRSFKSPRLGFHSYFNISPIYLRALLVTEMFTLNSNICSPLLILARGFEPKIKGLDRIYEEDGTGT